MAVLRKTYDWKRFWCPRGGTLVLSGQGFLEDPESEWGRAVNPGIVPFASIETQPCLVLLGEPGIGKTRAMNEEQSRIARQVTERREQVLWFNLGGYRSEERLARKLFESPDLLAWRRGTHRLHLFLDSLDECLLRIDTVYHLLLEELRNIPVARLSLRIACRTADWSIRAEEALRNLWGTEATGVYELAPLRRVDVAEAARANEIDADRFLQAVARLEAVPLAVKPVTLEMLLNVYRRDEQLSSSQVDLYRKGCLRLCEENNEERRDARLVGDLSAQQRFMIAGRLAAATVFTARHTIWTGVDRGDVPEDNIAILALCGGNERGSDGESFAVTEAGIREALDTGLFTSRGPNRMGWAHQTYAEFLAARYLVERKLPLQQILSLIVHPEDTGKLVPQLHEVAAWLAGMNPDVFRTIMLTDPEVLLRSDIAGATSHDRATLVEILLQMYDEGHLLVSGYEHYRWYPKLEHSGLVDQIRRYALDKGKGTMVRRVAIYIANTCRLQALQDELAEVALDPSEPLDIRVSAAEFVAEIGDDQTKSRLKPLALGKTEDNPHDELKGWGLKAAWPRCLTADELFAALTPPRREKIGDAYWTFMHGVAESLCAADIPVALRWVASQPRRHTSAHGYWYEKLMDGIMMRAWHHLRAPEVLSACSEAALARFRKFDDFVEWHQHPEFKEEVRSSHPQRRILVQAIIARLSNPDDEAVWRLANSPLVARGKDVPWLLELLKGALPSESHPELAQLVHRVCNWQDPRQLEAIFLASRESPDLAEAFAADFVPVCWQSDESQKIKAKYLRRLEREQGYQRPHLEPAPSQRIVALLDAVESGKLEAWWQLNQEMTLQDDNTHYENEFEPDLAVLPGWKQADDVTRARITAAAKDYVLKKGPDLDQWLGTEHFYFPAAAGYRALRLLLSQDPEFVTAMSADVWQRWAATILAYPVVVSSERHAPDQRLMEMAYHHAADEIIRTVLIIIDQENEGHRHITILHKLEGCWDDRLAAALVSKVRDPALNPENMRRLLNQLLAHNVHDAREFASNLLALRLPSEKVDRTRCVAAAAAIMTHSEDVDWSVVWPALQEDPEFGRAVITAVVDARGKPTVDIRHQLREHELAELYLWLERQFPRAEDPPEVEGARSVGTRDFIAEWRGSVFRELRSRGTLQACAAIERISAALAEQEWLTWELYQARAEARRRSWVPIHPEDLMSMVERDDHRLVQGGDQFLEVLMESLHRLGAKMQGETPVSFLLWCERKDGAYRPRDENDLSDFVKWQLDEDLNGRGVVVNREVVIRRGRGASRGERTDIHADAISKGSDGDSFNKVTVIIEVKGCWHRDLRRAMQTQLVSRYLRENYCQHGIYLVGWFPPDQWDPDDRRRDDVPKLNQTELQAELDAQAQELSRQGLKLKAFVLNVSLR